MRALTLLGVGTLLGSVAIGGAVAEDEPTRPAEKHPLYWTDQRLEAPVYLRKQDVGFVEKPALFFVKRGEHPDEPDETYPVRPVRVSVIPAEQVVKAIREQTKAGVYIHPEFGLRYVTLNLRPGSAREVMASLEESFPARWWKNGDRWLLARTLQDVSLMVLSPEQRLKARVAALSDTLKSIPAPAWRALADGRTLPLDAMPPATQRALWQRLRLGVTDPTSAPSPRLVQALNGGRLTLRLLGSGKDATLEVNSQQGTVLMIPFFHPVHGNLHYGVPPPR